MAEKNNEMGFDTLLGATREQIVNYFGSPDMDMFSLMIFNRNENFLILKFSLEEGSVNLKETVRGYLTISSKNQVWAKGIGLIDNCKVQEIKHCESISDVLKEYGSVCEMGGSTFERPMFFTDYGTILILITEEDHIREIRELTVYQLLQK